MIPVESTAGTTGVPVIPTNDFSTSNHLRIITIRINKDNVAIDPLNSARVDPIGCLQASYAFATIGSWPDIPMDAR